MRKRLTEQIDDFGETVVRMVEENIQFNEIAKYLIEQGVRQQYPDWMTPDSDDETFSKVTAALRVWVKKRHRVIWLQRRIVDLQMEIEAADAEIEQLLAQPPKKKIDRLKDFRMRNWAIYDRRQAGEKITEIAKSVDLSYGRVQQIIDRCHRYVARVSPERHYPEFTDGFEAAKRKEP